MLASLTLRTVKCMHLKSRWAVSGSLSPAIGNFFQVIVTAGEREQKSANTDF